MIAKILCPVDRSTPSHRAAQEASRIATALGAHLTLLHVMDPLIVPVPGGPLVPFSPDREDEVRNREWLQTYQADAAALGATTDIALATGRPSDTIVAHAKAMAADLIVIATHGSSGLDHFLLGSTTEKVLRLASCPVLTVTPSASATFREPFKRVLCAVDFSDCSLKALEFAMTTALNTGAELTLAHVLQWPWHEPPAPDFEELPEEEGAVLKRYRERRESEAMRRLEGLQPESLKGRCHALVLHGAPHVALLDLAAARGADLIVLGVRGRGALDLAVFGSTTNQIIRRAACPVVTVR